MGADPQPQIVRTLPVADVMEAFCTGTGEIADFILLVAETGKLLQPQLIKIGRFVLVRDSNGSRSGPGGQRRAFFYNQTVSGDMLGPESCHPVNAFPEVGETLPGKGEHQVGAETGEPRFPRQLKRFFRLKEGMDASQGTQQFILHGLHAHGKTVHAMAPNAFQPFRSQGSRIGF